MLTKRALDLSLGMAAGPLTGAPAQVTKNNPPKLSRARIILEHPGSLALERDIK